MPMNGMFRQRLPGSMSKFAFERFFSLLLNGTLASLLFLGFSSCSRTTKIDGREGKEDTEAVEATADGDTDEADLDRPKNTDELGLTRDQVGLVIHQHMSQVESCHEESLSI